MKSSLLETCSRIESPFKELIDTLLKSCCGQESNFRFWFRFWFSLLKILSISIFCLFKQMKEHQLLSPKIEIFERLFEDSPITFAKLSRSLITLKQMRSHARVFF